MHALMFTPYILRKGGSRKYLDVVAANRRWPTLRETAGMAFTFCVVVVAWILFRSETITDAGRYIAGMFSSSLFTRPWGYGPENMLWRTLIFIVVMLVLEWVQRRKECVLDLSDVKSAPLRWLIYYAFIITVFIVYYKGGVETFIYFQF